MNLPPFHYKKHLGQNFLIDERIQRRIVALARISGEETVVEIGPGNGAITRHLLAAAGRLVVVEIDPRLIPVLEARFGDAPHIEILHENALRFDFTAHLSEAAPKAKVVANLPYSIVTPLLFHLLKHRRVFSEFLLMLPEELADRILAPPGNRAYGILSVLLRNVSEISKRLTIPPAAFRPRPRIASAIVHFDLLDRPRVGGGNEAKFQRVVRAAFCQRRKTLRNALSAGIPALSPGEAQRACEAAGISPQRRAETLTLEEFGRLADTLPL
ncbi:MAG: ribosomal RNA small subunit methyltransferase A [Deltaproteobacteria bacterium]|nr:MAG: ribosomal RNA small subunit methyltransferase A [Deltaproteobacteria bacterium]